MFERIMQILGVAIAVAIGGIGYANAADLGSMKDLDRRDRAQIVTPAAQVETNWTGLWASALVGYSMSNTDLSFDIFDEDEGGTENFNLAHVNGFGGEGFTGTLQLGGDVQVRGLVIGAFGEYAFGGIQSDASVFDGAMRLDVEQKDSWSVLARIGVPVGNTLFYAAAGYTEMTFEATVRAGDDSASRDLDFSGVPVELGVEHKFSPNIRGKLAARYTILDEETVLRFGDEDEGARLTAEPGVFEVKAGIVISTGGLGLFSGN